MVIGKTRTNAGYGARAFAAQTNDYYKRSTRNHAEQAARYRHDDEALSDVWSYERNGRAAQRSERTGLTQPLMAKSQLWE